MLAGHPFFPRGGFTLVEMIVVLVLIGLLAGSVVVSLDGRDDAHVLMSDAKNLCDTIRHAQDEAYSTRRETRVIFDDARRSYHVESLQLDGRWIAVRGMGGRGRTLHDNVVVEQVQQLLPGSSHQVSLGFGPGRAGFDGQLKLTGKRGRVLVIDVMSETAQAHVIP